jgi:hypothetical protein
VLEWIRAQPALTTLVVIFYSSSDGPRDWARAYRPRANAFAPKPPALAQRLEFARLFKGWWPDQNRFPAIDGTDFEGTAAIAGSQRRAQEA